MIAIVRGFNASSWQLAGSNKRVKPSWDIVIAGKACENRENMVPCHNFVVYTSWRCETAAS